MLQEVLLALAGYRSALFDSLDDFSPDLSPAELELLSRLRHLATIHSQIRAHAQRIADVHPSIVCRATATSIQSSQLAKFRKRILEVEESILKKDAGLVGAYNIVPLAYLVSEFKQYQKLLQWLWDVTKFMAPEGFSADDAILRPGSGLINHLRDEAITGYPELEKASKELGVVAEIAWAKQLSSWVLYGQIPRFGADDFAVQILPDGGFELRTTLLPHYVSNDTASAILFVGKVRNLLGPSHHSDQHLLQSHVAALSTYSHSLAAPDLASAIEHIRLSLSSDILRTVLPLEHILEKLNILHDYFLLADASFAHALVAQGDVARKALPRESVAGDVLVRTFYAVERITGSESLDVARRCVRLTMQKPSDLPTLTSSSTSSSSSTTSQPAPFTDSLLASPTYLTLHCPTPFDLFLPTSATYTLIHAFLLSLRRSRLHLSNLWTYPPLRRHAPPHRFIWATAKAALDLLSHMSAYFAADVVDALWTRFMHSVRSAGAAGDFEALVEAQRQVQEALVSGLLLRDAGFTACARDFFGHVEVFANVLRDGAGRAEIVQDGAEHNSALQRAREVLDLSMRRLVKRLRQMDANRSEEVRPETGKGHGMTFGGVDRLLLKLSFDEVGDGDGDGEDVGGGDLV